MQALRHCTGRTAYRGSRCIALLFHDHGTRRGERSASRPGSFTPRKDPVPIVQEAEWVPGPVWTGAENLAPTGIRSPDCTARSYSLYLLSSRPTRIIMCITINVSKYCDMSELVTLIKALSSCAVE